MMDIKEVFLVWFIDFFIKKSVSGEDVTTPKNQTAQNQQLAEELHKPLLENL